MKSIYDLYAFAEELIEYALMGGDETTADVIEDALDAAMTVDHLDEQIAEMAIAFLVVEERVIVPNYPIESVMTLREMMRAVNLPMTRKRYLH